MLINIARFTSFTKTGYLSAHGTKFLKYSLNKVGIAQKLFQPLFDCFTIPFISSARNISTISVAVNGWTIEGSIWYGDGVFGTDNTFDVDTVYSPIMDESITGTLYTVIPDKDTITISLSFNDRKSYIYETSNYLSSSHSADGNHT